MEKTATLNIRVNPDSINVDLMTETKLHTKLQKGYDNIAVGNVQDAASAFANFREKH